MCINNVIPTSNLSVKLGMHFIHSPTRKIQIYMYIRSCMAKKFQKKITASILCHKLSSTMLFKICQGTNGFNASLISLNMVLFCNSFGNWFKQSRALRLLIKMLIGCCLKREGCSVQKSSYHHCVCIMKQAFVMCVQLYMYM